MRQVVDGMPPVTHVTGPADGSVCNSNNGCAATRLGQRHVTCQATAHCSSELRRAVTAYRGLGVDEVAALLGGLRRLHRAGDGRASASPQVLPETLTMMKASKTRPRNEFLEPLCTHACQCRRMGCSGSRFMGSQLQRHQPGSCVQYCPDLAYSPCFASPRHPLILP